MVPGSVVEIEVVADNTRVPNSRWYTGTGIYRPVWLRSTGAVRIARDGVRIVTRERGSASVTVLTEGAPAGADVEVAFAFAGDETVIGLAAVGALAILPSPQITSTLFFFIRKATPLESCVETPRERLTTAAWSNDTSFAARP